MMSTTSGSVKIRSSTRLYGETTTRCRAIAPCSARNAAPVRDAKAGSTTEAGIAATVTRSAATASGPTDLLISMAEKPKIPPGPSRSSAASSLCCRVFQMSTDPAITTKTSVLGTVKASRITSPGAKRSIRAPCDIFSRTGPGRPSKGAMPRRISRESSC